MEEALNRIRKLTKQLETAQQSAKTTKAEIDRAAAAVTHVDKVVRKQARRTTRKRAAKK